jgi:hypothetical protein
MKAAAAAAAAAVTIQYRPSTRFLTVTPDGPQSAVSLKALLSEVALVRGRRTRRPVVPALAQSVLEVLPL